VQELAVGVDPVGADKDLQVSHQMGDDEEHQHEAADAHDVLLPEGRAPDFHQKIHEARIRDTTKPNLSSEGCRVKSALQNAASIRSADFPVPLYKLASFKEFGTLIHTNNAVGISRTTDVTVGDIVVLHI
jgi:hypothetical protein